MTTEGVRTNVLPRLWVYVVSGENLRNVSRFGKMSPHVEISQSSLVSKTKVSKKGHTAPSWMQLIFVDILSTNSNVQIRVMNGSSIIGAISLAPKHYKDGLKSKFHTITVKDPKKGRDAGLLKLSWQLQYPHSVIVAPTDASRNVFLPFCKYKPKSRMFMTVYGTRNFRVGKRSVEEVFCEVSVCGGKRTMKARNVRTEVVFNQCVAIPVYFDKEEATRYKSTVYAPKFVKLILYHKTWSGTKVDGSVTIPFTHFSKGNPMDKWIDLGGKGGNIRIRFQLQLPDCVIMLPGTPVHMMGGVVEPPRRSASVPASNAIPAARPISVSRGESRSRPASGRTFAAADSFQMFFETLKDTGVSEADARRLYRESKYGEDTVDHVTPAKPAPLPPPPPPSTVPDASLESATDGGGGVPSAPVMTVSELEHMARAYENLPVADPAHESYLSADI